MSLGEAKTAALVSSNSRRSKHVINLWKILHNSDFCTICLDVKDPLQLLHLDDLISQVDWEQRTHTLPIREVLRGIFASTDILFSEYICEPCTSLAASSYSFISKTKSKVETFSRYLHELNKETVTTADILDQDCNNVLFVLEESFLTKKKASIKKDQKPSLCICDLCGKEFLKKLYLLRHLKRHKNSCIRGCPHNGSRACASTMIQNKSRSRKNRVKRPKPTYKCLTCDKVFRTQRELRAHIRTHETKPNLCLYCNKQLDSRQEYLDHVQTDEHRRNKPGNHYGHHCSQCDYAASTSVLLTAHVNRVHLNIRPFKCPHCPKSYFDESELKNHIKIHTGEVKPKVCDICGAHLAGPSALKKHRRLHTGERPYACQYCDKTTTNASDLKMHILRKHTEKSVSCPICGMLFYTIHNARGHVKSAHWKRKEKFDYTKLEGLSPKDYDFFRDRRKAVM